MRNDALDELDNVPSLTTDARDHEFPADHHHDHGLWRGHEPEPEDPDAGHLHLVGKDLLIAFMRTSRASGRGRSA